MTHNEILQYNQHMKRGYSFFTLAEELCCNKNYSGAFGVFNSAIQEFEIAQEYAEKFLDYDRIIQAKSKKEYCHERAKICEWNDIYDKQICEDDELYK